MVEPPERGILVSRAATEAETTRTPAPPARAATEAGASLTPAPPGRGTLAPRAVSALWKQAMGTVVLVGVWDLLKCGRVAEASALVTAWAVVMRGAEWHG